MNYQLLGENIQIIRKHRKMKQQELADAIGINLQSLSKIEWYHSKGPYSEAGKDYECVGCNPE